LSDIKVLLRLRRLVFSSSSRWPEFVTRSARIGFMLEVVTLRHVFLGVLLSFSGIIIPPMLHISAPITDFPAIYIYIILTIDSVGDTHNNFTHLEQFKFIQVSHILSLFCGGNYNNHRSVALRAPRIDTLQQTLPWRGYPSCFLFAFSD